MPRPVWAARDMPAECVAAERDNQHVPGAHEAWESCTLAYMSCSFATAEDSGTPKWDAAISRCIDKDIRSNGTSGNGPASKYFRAQLGEASPSGTSSKSFRTQASEHDLLDGCRHDFSADDKVFKSDVETALKDCAAVIRSRNASTHDVADAHAWRAIQFVFLNEFDRAIKEASDAISMDETASTAYFARGQAYSFNDKYDLAIADFSRFLDLTPEVPRFTAQAYFFRGGDYCYEKHFNRAIEDFDRAVNAHPSLSNHNLAQLYNIRGMAEKALGHTQEAEADRRTAKQLDPTAGQ